MENNTLYSIGHGNKTIDVFISELKAFDIKYLLDVRSSPYSKWNPQFNQNELKFKLKECDIEYVFVGDQLGGLPKDKSCYIYPEEDLENVNPDIESKGKVDYDLIKTKDFFKDGISRLITAYNKNIPLAIMCSESKPEECHRSKLIGQFLFDKNIEIQHIVANKKIKSQITVMNELTKGRGTTDLFGNQTGFTSRKTY